MLVKKSLLLKYLDTLKSIEELQLSDIITDKEVKQSTLIVDTFKNVADQYTLDSDMSFEFEDDLFTNHINAANEKLSYMKTLNSELKQIAVAAAMHDMMYNTNALSDSCENAKEIAHEQENKILFLENKIRLDKIMEALCC